MNRSEEEINDQLCAAVEAMDQGSKYPGMSYEEGVKYALEWVLGYSDEKPMED